jgi:glycosyltransferase involved in cell wall biosynthesis
MSAPVTVSVVIPCHDSSPFLRATVESVTAEGMPAEVILVDDGSTDGTRALIDRLIGEHPERRMTLVAQSNAGVAAARNAGVAASRGRYILPLDADDLIAPTTLESCAAILDADPETALVFPDREDFGELEGRFVSGPFDLGRLKYFNQVPYCAMYRREVWGAIGGYRVNVSGFDDWDFWIAAAARGFRGHHLQRPLLRHRRHRTSQLATTLRDYERLFATIILNNAEVYSQRERVAAQRYLAGEAPSAVLAVGRLMFERGYPMPPGRRS